MVSCLVLHITLGAALTHEMNFWVNCRVSPPPLAGLAPRGLAGVISRKQIFLLSETICLRCVVLCSHFCLE